MALEQGATRVDEHTVLAKTAINVVMKELVYTNHISMQVFMYQQYY